mmetsp:Transcript_14429/g.17540  ORF Transcript_14429/g.17540 Transcript_14429/m.17540 type:complete len:296 (+) Transcript_14429:123-1010(+)
MVTPSSFQWALEFEKANSDLAYASHQIQATFHHHHASASAQCDDDDPIPDPVDLLGRIAALESTISSLQVECEELVTTRPLLSQQVTSLMLQNYEAIQMLSVLAKGKHHAKMHPATENLSNQTKQQEQYWTDQCKKDGIDINQEKKEQQKHDKLNNSNVSKSSISSSSVTAMSITSSLQIHQDSDGVLIAHLPKEQFDDLSESIRGRCKLEHVQNVASFLCQEVTNRFEEGYRGKHLHIERQQLVKYCGAYPGLYSVIMNTSLWRDIVSTLQSLEFVKVDKEGCLILMHTLPLID